MRGTFAIPEATSRFPDTPRDELERRLQSLAAARPRWAATPLRLRAAMLDQAITDTLAIAPEWVGAACREKGIPTNHPVAGEEWQSGPGLTIRQMRLSARTLRQIQGNGGPKVGKVSALDNGVTVAKVFPADVWDALLFTGVKAEVWMDDGVTPENLAEHTAGVYRNPPEPRVALVLGAGNINSIPALDALTKLIAENSVVILKMNPVNAYLGPILEDALSVFVDAGFLSIVYGGADVGEFLVTHPLVETIHITGSDKAHDAIVFGTGEEGASRKAARNPRLDKPITSELGNVTPVIVVPGPWSDGDLTYQGANLASGLTHNAGFNCIANRVVITHSEWDRRQDLLASVRRALTEIPTRFAYYPGAEERLQRYLDGYGDAVSTYGVAADGRLPWTTVSVAPDDEKGMCFETECWTGLMAETAISAPTPAEFVRQAVEFANTRLWGTLGATLVVHPKSMKDPEVRRAVEQAIADLRYGNVSVNIWVAVAYAAVTTTWGAFPGHELHDIQSGRGVVHNALLFDRPLKSVAYAPFRQFPKPPWFGTNRMSHQTLEALTRHDADPSIGSFLSVVSKAIRG